jgi:alpha-methylacyl-CoA racemase
MAGGPLAGVRVVEFAGIGPAPFVAMLLSDMGAQVLRIDRPGAKPATPLHFEQRGRRHMQLDLKQPAALATILDLTTRADILIEGFRPGVMERLGLGPETAMARNAALVYGRITGWGQNGPYAQMAGHDLNYAALSGAIAAIGPADRPVPPLNLLGDFGGGAMMLSVGVLAALAHARVTGTGQVVDAAMSDGVSYLMTLVYQLRANGMWADERAANLIDGGAPYYACYRCADGAWISIAALEPHFFAQLASFTAMPEELAANRDARGNWAKLSAFFEQTFARADRAHWCALFEGTDICFAPVLNMREAADHPHNVARDAFRTVAGAPCPNPAPRFSATPMRVAHEAGKAPDAPWDWLAPLMEGAS